MKTPLLKCLRQAQAVCLAGLVAGGVMTIIAVADLVPLSAHAAASEASAQVDESLPDDAAFSTKLGEFASGPPCNSNVYLLCAGPTTEPNRAPSQYGSPMAHPGLGIPLGGVGTGAFMINQAGTFGPWDMGGSINTNYENRILPQAAFHVRVQSRDASPTMRTLAVNNSQLGSVLPAWKTLSAGHGTYSALYPFGAIDYGSVANGTGVALKFWSPFVANDEELLSQPVAYFDVKVSNTSSETSNVSMMLTFPNAPTHVASKVHGLNPPSIASTRTGFYSNYNVDPTTNVHGVTLGASSPQNTPDSENSEWTVAVRVEGNQEVSYTTSWNSDGSGEDVYTAFCRDGKLPNAPLDDSHSAGALAVSVKLAPLTSTVIHYALAWDFPQVGFGDGQGTVWMRRYTSFYGGREDSANNYVQGSYPFRQGFTIASKNLAREDASLQKVFSWWRSLAANDAIPSAIRRVGLNQVHQLVWTGPFWECGLVKTNQTPTSGGPRLGSQVPGTHMYYMRTGGGWSSASEANVQGHAILPMRELMFEAEKAWVRATSEQVMQNPFGRVPDKFGSVAGTPFLSWGASNATAAPKAAYFDTTAKYLIRAFGTVRADKTDSSLREFYPAMLRAYNNDVAKRIPADKALPIEPILFGNTYDILGIGENSHGVYNSGLYLLSLEIMIAATQEARALGVAEAKTVDVAQLEAKLAAGKAAYENAFWTGSYYRVASEGRRYTDMFSDTLWPQHQAQLLGLPDLVPTTHIVSHLQTAFKVLLQNKDATGHLIGAPNLVPVNSQPYPFVQLPPRNLPNEFAAENGFDKGEVWLGTNYELAATFIEAGKRFGLTDLIANGHAIAEAIAYQVYSPSAAAKGTFVFNEPNAYYGGDPTTYRGVGMSRNLAAWDLLKAAAIPFGITETSGGGGETVPPRHSR